MAIYGRKFSIAFFISFMLTLSSIDHQIACKVCNKDDLLKQQTQALGMFINETLLNFITNKTRKSELEVDWNKSKSVCDWKGIDCDPYKKYVMKISLPAASLVGKIPEGTIGNISTLTTLSLRNNSLTGPIPSDFSNLQNLLRLSLQHNKFSGPLPDLKNLTHLKKHVFNVSYNNLEDCIPPSFSSFDKSSFTQNVNLRGDPLKPDQSCPTNSLPSSSESSPPGDKSKNNKQLSTGAIVGIAIGSPLLFLILLLCLQQEINMKPYNTQAPIRPQTSSTSKDEFMEGERSKLVIFEEDGIYSKFGVGDLLQAPAEVLGKGRIGTTYRVLIKEGEVEVVVKRLKEVVVTNKDDFESRMNILGKMNNQNVVPLRAYHCSEVEKLLVYDYFPAGSVHDLLHGGRGSGQIRLDWEERMGIALSAAKGLAYLHVSEKLVHGNFKSSNILLRQGTTNNEAFVSDYGLNILFESSPIVTMESDVYSFGIFLLEILTRKVPQQKSSGKEGFDLPQLIQSVRQEEYWKTKVFDTELMTHQNYKVEEEMVRLLDIAMLCVSFVPNQQPTMDEVVKMMNDMNRDIPSIVTQ